MTQQATHKPICLITGCSGTIGSYIAQHLISQNWRVWGITRKIENTKMQPEINWLIGDLMDPEKHLEIIKKLTQQGSFDAIIHCLGFSPDYSLLNMEPAHFQQALILNFSSIQKINQALIPYLNRSSTIIHLGSRVAKMGNPGQIAYSTAKGILADYTKILASELGKNDITVNMILPGVHASDMLGANHQQVMENAKKASLLNRLTAIEDVANAVQFLLNARTITGQIFPIESRLIE